MRYIKIHTHTQMDNKKGAQSRYYYIESKEVLKSLKKIEKKDVDGACRTRRFSRRGLFSPFKFLLTPKKEKKKKISNLLVSSSFPFRTNPLVGPSLGPHRIGTEKPVRPSPFIFRDMRTISYTQTTYFQPY